MERLFELSTSPLYTQVADVLRQRIAKDVWPVGGRIPTLPALAAEFAVASITVRQAIQLLKSEGLLSPEQGRGTFVRAKPAQHPRMQIATSLMKLVELYRADAPRLIPLDEGIRAPRIERDEGTPAPKYRFLRRIHERERQYNSVISAYLDERVFRLAPKRFRREVVISVLIDLPGVRIASARQTLTIGTAGAETAHALNISVNAPVAEIRRVFRAADGTVIFVGELAYRGDFIRLDMDLLA
jgi:GntR family transcriptional regulator